MAARSANTPALRTSSSLKAPADRASTPSMRPSGVCTGQASSADDA